MSENDVVTLVTVAGEFIGRFKEENELTITIERPRALMTGENGLGFAPGVCMTGETDGDVQFNRSSVLCMVETMPEVQKAWLSATSGIMLT